jgi:hypothetical protein
MYLQVIKKRTDLHKRNPDDVLLLNKAGNSIKQLIRCNTTYSLQYYVFTSFDAESLLEKLKSEISPNQPVYDWLLNKLKENFSGTCTCTFFSLIPCR